MLGFSSCVNCGNVMNQSWLDEDLFDGDQSGIAAISRNRYQTNIPVSKSMVYSAYTQSQDMSGQHHIKRCT